MTIKQRFNVILDGLYPYKHRIDPLKWSKNDVFDRFLTVYTVILPKIMLIGAYRPLYRASIGLYGYKTPFFSLYRPYRAPIGLITILSIIFLTTNLRFLKSFKKVAVEA